MRPGEYQAGLRGDSWKLDLIQAINDALEYADDRESFVENMEYEGYEVIWTDTRKHITFVCPDGRRCRDSSLHDETFLKENLETLFAYRQAVGFRPNTPEPEEGWMGELASELVRLGRSIEEADDLPPLPAPPAWTESKQRHREALKKLALGQKLSRGRAGSRPCGESYGRDCCCFRRKCVDIDNSSRFRKGLSVWCVCKTGCRQRRECNAYTKKNGREG